MDGWGARLRWQAYLFTFLKRPSGKSKTEDVLLSGCSASASYEQKLPCRSCHRPREQLPPPSFPCHAWFSYKWSRALLSGAWRPRRWSAPLFATVLCSRKNSLNLERSALRTNWLVWWALLSLTHGIYFPAPCKNHKHMGLELVRFIWKELGPTGHFEYQKGNLSNCTEIVDVKKYKSSKIL